MAQNRHSLEPPVFPLGDISAFNIRASAILTTAEVIAKAHNSDDSDGWFNVQGCDFINVWLRWTDGTSAADVSIFMDFANAAKSAVYRAVAMDSVAAGGIVEVQPAKYTSLDEGNYVFSIPNPGAAWARCTVLGGSGTLTSSTCILDITRSFGGSLQREQQV